LSVIGQSATSSASRIGASLNSNNSVRAAGIVCENSLTQVDAPVKGEKRSRSGETSAIGSAITDHGKHVPITHSRVSLEAPQDDIRVPHSIVGDADRSVSSNGEVLIGEKPPSTSASIVESVELPVPRVAGKYASRTIWLTNFVQPSFDEVWQSTWRASLSRNVILSHYDVESARWVTVVLCDAGG